MRKDDRGLYPADKVLSAMEDLAEDGYVATTRAIRKRSGIKSTATVHDALVQLAAEGRIKRVLSEAGGKAVFFALVNYKCPVCGRGTEDGHATC